MSPPINGHSLCPLRCYRVFNVQQSADALLGYQAVRKVEYNPVENPTRMVSDGHVKPPLNLRWLL